MIQENIKFKQKLAQLYEKRQKQNRSLLIILLALLLIYLHQNTFVLTLHSSTMLTQKEIEKILRIFFQIQPSTVSSIHNYNSIYEFRQCIIVGIQITKYKPYDALYINIENITPWQLTTFVKRSKKEVPGKAFTEQHGNVTRLDFR